MVRKRENTQPVARSTPLPMKIAFDAWWAMNEKKIASHHYKEVILADMRSRGLSLKETAQSYDEGLRMYGLKIK